MTAQTAKPNRRSKDFDATVAEGLTTVKFKGAIYEITPDGNVAVHTNADGVKSKLADPRVAADAEDPSVRISPERDAFTAYGVSVKMTEEGPLVSTNGLVVVKPFAANDKPEIGDEATDGWIYAGESPETGKPMYVAPEDSRKLTWAEAAKAAEDLQAQGIDARLPSQKELREIFCSRAAIGGFVEELNPDSWYWSSKAYEDIPAKHLTIRVTNGFICAQDNTRSSVRLVRN